MSLLNGPHGYGSVTKLLHWLTVVLLVGQVVLGYTMETWSELLTETDEGDADEAIVFVHGWVGGVILVLAALRLAWRLSTPLPPWSERLTALDRRLEHRLEQVLYALLFLIPGTGLALLLLSGEEREVGVDEVWRAPYDLLEDDLLLNAHIASHFALYLTVVVHTLLALRRRTLTRML